MSEIFRCKNGQEIQIIIDEGADFEATVTGPNGEKIGTISFRQFDECGSYLKLTWMYLDKSGDRWKLQGIGREVLRRVKEVSGLPITAGSHDGHRRDDGSHLTGDAPSFVDRMRQEGIIEEQLA